MGSRRVRLACDRCRRQKLKCDEGRPCQLCIRSKAMCIEPTISTKHRSKRMKLDARSSNGSLYSKWSHQGMKIGYPLFTSFSSYSSLEERDLAPQGIHTVVPLRQVLGMGLPPENISLLLFNAYIKYMHWYMLVFHEPTLRAQLECFLRSRRATDGDLCSLLLILIVLIIGARFLTEDDYENLLSIQDISLHSITFQYLLGSYYLIAGCPQQAFLLAGASLRVAHAEGLHQERTWGRVDEVERHTRRRLWWMLFVSDGYTSQAYDKHMASLV
ncbi:Fungal Zn2-Cys6 binuclear cluster domain-containing protein [Cladophialophora immunda]|nr:Fungal Zn2-Cys6 binuclear cluster domain-containing protein [Cladophialophora immunda]